MKTWCLSLILLSLCARFAKNLFPCGERSPLYAPLRFLLSLSLAVVIFSPFMRFLQKGEVNVEPFAFTETASIDGDKLVLEQMGKTMKKSVDTAFPDTQYKLEIYTEEGFVPSLVAVVCENQGEAEKIAAFIEKNYNLKATAKDGR